MNHIDLVGTWALSKFETIGLDGACRNPLGAGAVGQLIYTRDGRVSALLMSCSRTQVGVGPEQLARMPRGLRYVRAGIRFAKGAREFYGYGGTYVLDGLRVSHAVEVSSYADIIGTVLQRDVNLEDEWLTLSYKDPTGEVNRMIWNRTGNFA
jgi:hypothetical protein